MSKIQYTIRSVPPKVDQALRKKAKKTGKSLNELVVEALTKGAGVKPDTTVNDLDWFYGSGIDDDTLRALEEDARLQKELATKEI
jgi:hypothetical protein